MGFGHRVYKNYDPRAKLVRKVRPGQTTNNHPDQSSHARLRNRNATASPPSSTISFRPFGIYFQLPFL